MLLTNYKLQNVYDCLEKKRPNLGCWNGFYLEKNTGKIYRVKFEGDNLEKMEGYPVDRLQDKELQVIKEGYENYVITVEGVN